MIIPASYCLQLFALNPACVVLLLWYSYENIEGVINSRKKANLPSACPPGTVITIPANVKHWHGAKADSWFSHIAVEVPGEDCSNEWCEPVTDEEYAKLNG